jgi:type I restriction enzyme S subunit
MSAGWRKVALGDHVDLLSGFAFKSARYTEEPNDVRLLRGDNIAQGFLRWDGAKRWARDDMKAYDRFELQEGDVVLAMDRPWIDAGLKWGWVRRPDLPLLLVQRVARMRGRDGLDTGFLRYVIGSDAFTSYVKSITTGVNVPHVSGPDIKKYRFLLPPATIQGRIADILSAYDDLIENNTKRIKILEEMARSLYREWFVDFRFPGHEKVKLVESAIGRVPSGWAVHALDAITTMINRGVAPKYADDGPELVLNQKCIRDQRLSLEPARKHISRVPTDKYVQPFDVLINSTGVGTLGRVAQVIEEIPGCTVDTHVTVVRAARHIDPHFFGMSLLAKGQHFEAEATGATGQTELSRGRIGATELVVPPAPLQERFGGAIGPMRRTVHVLCKRNENLRRARDLLLPRLLAGEIDVSRLAAPL